MHVPRGSSHLTKPSLELFFGFLMWFKQSYILRPIKELTISPQEDAGLMFVLLELLRLWLSFQESVVQELL
jgi:hypothetical protein